MDEAIDQYEQIAQRIRQRAPSDYVPDPATDAEIAVVEGELGYTLPDSYKRLQKEFGEYSGVADIYGVKPTPSPLQNIVGITMVERYECFPPVPDHLIPFSDNGGGDSYCFDTSRLRNGECPVVFWDHEGDQDQQPEPCAATFLDRLEEAIES